MSTASNVFPSDVFRRAVFLSVALACLLLAGSGAGPVRKGAIRWFEGKDATVNPAGALHLDADKSWAFHPGKDPFKADALFDLRSLNEKTAGEKGFVRLSADGSGFLLGDGTPVRFWAVDDTVYRKTNAELAYHARFLAKFGVNMVRMHGSFSPKGKGTKITDFDKEEIDRAWRLVAAMKKQGIYTTISPYWASGGHTGTAASWGIEGHGDKADLWGLLFFRDDLKAGYKAWTKALLTRRNPYTGIALGKDPAVAILQIQNEDSLFFWTLQGLKPPQMALLGKEIRRVARQEVPHAGRRPRRLGQLQGGRRRLRQLQGRHSVELAHDPADEGRRRQTHARPGTNSWQRCRGAFMRRSAEYFRKDLGCKQLVNASNWVTADPEKLNDVERWTYTANDVVAVNKYYAGGPHNGPNAGWRIDPNDFFEGRSALKNPTALPTSLKQVVGHPTMITESCWVYPLAYESEGPFLIAAYGGPDRRRALLLVQRRHARLLPRSLLPLANLPRRTEGRLQVVAASRHADPVPGRRLDVSQGLRPPEQARRS